MQHFQPILIIIGLLAIAAVLIHGYLISRKNKTSETNASDHEQNIIDEQDNDDLQTFNINNSEHEDLDEPFINLQGDVREADDLIIANINIENDNHDIQLDETVSNKIENEVILESDLDTLAESEASETEPSINNEQDDEVLAEQPPQVTKEKPMQDAQDIFIFNVVAKEDSYIRGHTLLQFFLTAGFRFGKMNIFHRHLHSDGTGPILFSIANMMAPGVFHPTKMKQLHSEGVSFFLTAPNDDINIKEAFDMMLVAVQQMADEFDCIVLNADREPMTEEQFREYHQRLLHYI